MRKWWLCLKVLYSVVGLMFFPYLLVNLLKERSLVLLKVINISTVFNFFKKYYSYAHNKPFPIDIFMKYKMTTNPNKIIQEKWYLT